MEGMYEYGPTDIVLICRENVRMSAHKEILAKSSQFFQTLFDSPLEAGNTTFPLPNITAAILERVLRYAYTGSVFIEENLALELLKTAVYFSMSTLQRQCEEFLEEHAALSDYFMIQNFAEAHDCQLLAQRIGRKMCERADEFFSQPEYLQMSASKLLDMLSSDDLNIQAEESVWEIVRNWYLTDKKQRGPDFLDLLGAVRFPLMKAFSLARIEMEDVTQDPQFSGHIRSLLDEARHLLQRGDWTFVLNHPKYHLRNPHVESGIIIASHRDAELELTDKVVMYNPTTNVLNQLPRLHRKFRPSIVCRDNCGRIYFGSITAKDFTIFCYSHGPAAPWSQIGQLSKVYKADICVVKDELVSVGKQHRTAVLECLSLKTGQLTFSSFTLPFQFYEAKVVAMFGSVVIFAQPEEMASSILRTWIFDPVSREFAEKSSSIVLRRDVTACVGNKGMIYVMGSSFQPEFDIRVEVYNSTENAWTILADVTNNQVFPALSYSEGKVTWFGRKKAGGGKWIHEIVEYDEVTGKLCIVDCADLMSYAFGIPSCCPIRVKKSAVFRML